ncbi:MAG: hypothetical protein JW751_16015 [Polyangiaceae bacterium]|nr:hypothetical protein [Polyangiaceae bacterium]
MGATAALQTIGKLGQTPLVEVLATMLAQRATGSIVFREPSGRKSALYLYLGTVAKAHTPALVLELPHPGEVVCQHVEWAAELVGTTLFGYYPDVDVLPDVSPAPTNPLALIWRCSQRSVHPTRLARYLERLGDRRLAFHPHARLDLFALGWDDLALLEPLRRAPSSATALVAGHGGDVPRLQRLIYVLVLCRHLDVGDGREPYGVTGQSLMMPAPSRSAPADPDDTVFREVTPPPRASTPRPPRKESGLAHRAMHQIRSGAPTQPAIVVGSSPPTSRESADESLARAEILAKRGEFERALELAERSRDGRFDFAARHAFVAYLRVRCGRLGAAQIDRAIEDCHRAVRELPDAPELRYYRGWVLKAVGCEVDAMRDFADVVRQDPKNIDAARELHLYRRRCERERTSNSGLVGMLKRSLSPKPAPARRTSSRVPRR